MSELKKEPTAAEAMLFFSIVKHTRNKADVDWDSVASEQGFKNADVAKVRFGQVKRKLGIFSDPAGPRPSPQKTVKKGAGGTTTPTRKVAKAPRSGGKSRAKAKVKKEETQEDEEEESAQAPAAVKQEEPQNEDDDEEAATNQLHREMNPDDFFDFSMEPPLQQDF